MAARLPRCVQTIFAFGLIAFAAVPSEARVSMRVRGEDAGAVVSALGGRTAYSADVEVNGQPAKIRVFGLEEESGRLDGALLNQLGIDTAALRNGAMARLPERFGKAWMLLMPGRALGSSVAMLIESPAELGAGEPKWLFPSLTPPPGFTLTFSATDRETRFALCSGHSPQPAVAALAIMCGTFERDGWIAATPAKDKVSAVFFVKGDQVALLSVVPNEDGTALLIMSSGRQPQ